MSQQALPAEKVREELEDMKIWGFEADKLVTRVEFENYKESVFFANTVFALAEAEYHHPRVVVEYGAVEIDLWSHDADGVTERDLELAEKVEEKLSEVKWS